MENLSDYKLIEGEFGKQVTLGSFSAKNIINSYGGDINVGKGAYSLLKSIPDSEMIAMGMCASAGTIAMLGAETKKGTKNSRFCIHNPMAAPKGDANKIQQVVDDLRAEENALVNLYVDELLIDEQEIRAMMVMGDKTFDAVRAKEIGLIDEIIEDDFSPTVENTSKETFFNFINQKKMSEEKITKEDLSKEFESQKKSILETITNIFKSKIQNILLKDTGGAELDFDVETEEQIAVGVNATIDGSPADGEYVMPSGETYVFTSGELTEIKEPESEGGDMEALKAENEELKAKLTELEGVNAESEDTIKNLKSGLEDVNTKVEKMTNVFSGKISNMSTPEENKKEEKSNKAFKSKRTIKLN